MDLRTSSGELPASTHDLTSCRALLHQISEYIPAVLARMAAALKPGGWLLVQEPDIHLAQTTESDVWTMTWKALIEWGQANGIEWPIGRGLPGMVSKLGLGQPQAKTDVQNIRGRDRGALRGALYFRLFFADVRERVLDAASALLEDVNYWTQSWMMTAVWVRKPPA